jgi:hypothetical protein
MVGRHGRRVGGAGAALAAALAVAAGSAPGCGDPNRSLGPIGYARAACGQLRRAEAAFERGDGRAVRQAMDAAVRDSALAARGDSGWRQLQAAVRLLRQDVLYGGQRPVQEGDCDRATNP